MKKLTPYLAFLIVGLGPLRADNCVQNGDFANGADHWRGDGQSPADLAAASSDPFAKPDPMLSKGLIIPLKEHSWTKITQDFRTKSADLELKIDYLLAPGTQFSSSPDDYVNIPKQIDNLMYLTFNISPQQLIVQFTDFGNGAKGEYFKFAPKFDSTALQTLHAQVSDFTPLEHEVVTIAFPPGKGYVVLQDISLE